MAQKSINLLLLIFVQQIFSALGIDARTEDGECDYELHPAVAVLYDYAPHLEDSVLCGGCLISLEWVLTRGTCILTEREMEGVKVHLRTGFGNDKFIQKRLAIKSVRHPKFNDHRDFVYNIGLFLANKPFENKAHLKPAKLPTPGFTSKCKTATAFGITLELIHLYLFSYAIVKPNEPLRCVQVPIFNRDACSQIKRERRREVLDETSICALDKTKDTCRNQFGMPFVCEGVVIGVYVADTGCWGNTTVENIYTNVEYFLEFIAEHTGKATGRHLPGIKSSGSNTIVLSKVLLVVVFLLYYIVFNGFGF